MVIDELARPLPAPLRGIPGRIQAIGPFTQHGDQAEDVEHEVTDIGPPATATGISRRTITVQFGIGSVVQ